MSGDVRGVVILARRLSIGGILALGYAYYSFLGGSAALAAIGLISFAGVAQFLPALAGGIFWRGATRSGAIAGLCVGFFLWFYTMLMPSFGPGNMLSWRRRKARQKPSQENSKREKPTQAKVRGVELTCIDRSGSW